MKATLVLSFLAAILPLAASPVTIHFIDTGNGVSDGIFYVGPYDITINGNPYKALCYDVFDESTPGDTWVANKLDISAVTSGGGQFSPLSGSASKYQEIAYLSSLYAPTPSDQIDLQHAIWSLFAPASVSVTTGVQSWLNLASLHAGSYNAGNTMFLEAPYRQALVVVSPEPAALSFALIGFGMLLIGKFALRMCRMDGQSDQRIRELR